VVLRYHEDEGRIKTVVGVLKTRRSWHSRQLRVFTINEKGIQIEKEKIEGEVMK
jgi:KaiC/GvpD/RAD55 family RecA-like ATPase